MKKKEWKRLAICAAAAVLAAVIIAVAGYFGTAYMQQRAADSYAAAEASGIITVDGKNYSAKKYLKTYLVMGIDKEGASQSMTNVNTQQTDFNALIIADIKSESYKILYLNRDTMTDIPVLALDGTPYTTRYQQLALAHTYGTGMEDSCENTANAVSALLGDITVDHYAAFYLGAIGTLNDAVGGVTVTVEDDLTPSDPALYIGATVKLDAQQAEYFVRSRINVADGTNLNRMKRQMTYLSAWSELASTKMTEDAAFATSLVNKLEGKVVTDLSVQQVSDLADVLNGYEKAGEYELAGEAVQGETYMEYYLDEDALQQTILELFYDAA